MNKIVNMSWKGALVAAALSFMPAYAEEVDFSKIPDVRLFKGDATIGYRDPAAWYEDGVFHLFITMCDPSVPRMTIGHTTSRNLVDWSPIEYVLPMDKRFNWSSPGSIVKDGDERVLCFQKYPTPDATPTKVAFCDDTARIYTIRTKDFKTWTKPELIMVKGPNVSEEEMGRMIDAYITKGTDGLWWCFYKQQQDESGRFSKKAKSCVPFSVSSDLKVWKQMGRTSGGENVCVLPDDKTGGWLMLHAPHNGIGFKRSTDLVHWTDCGSTVLGQKGWRWAKGRVTAATVIDCRAEKGVGKYVMFFHGSGPRKEIEGDCYKNCSIGIAWSDDLKEWTWPGKAGMMPPPVGQHCIYDAIPLEGAWEMSYCSNAWDSVACPKFKGVAVAKAVPGFWENMVPALRAAGMKDAFRINPAYERQTIPMTQWAKCTTLPNIYGCFLYRRAFTLEKLPRRPAFLAFDCVRNQVHAWVNGKFVAFRQGFSTPFELSIPNGVLREGENEIVLAVSNNPNNGYNGSDVSGLTTRGLFEATGGIDGRVELRFTRNGIRDVYVTTAKDLKTFTVHVGTDPGNLVGASVPFARNYTLAYSISDATGKVLAKGEAKGDFTLPTKGFSFWSPENPVRYTLTLTTPEGACSQKFGIRRLVPDGERMRLNGELTYLRGVTEHCYFPETVQLPRDLAYYRMITAKRKELGFNFLRFHTFVPTDEYLEAMDELGIMVHIESPNFVPLEEYDAIIRFARKHPCVVAYCTGNETWIDGTAEKYLESVAKLVHAETDSLFTPMSAMRNVEYMVRRGKDTADKPFLHVPSRMARLAAYSDYFTSYQLGAVSYDSLNGASAATIDAWGDAYCGKPRTMHETCIDGSFCDITLEKDYPKDSPITREGVFSEVRRHLAERGLLDRAPAYVRNSSEWMRRIRKFTFEKVRASRRIVGYDFLGDIDSRWHTFGYSDGMMDEFYRLKHGETVENVRRYNSAAVLLCSLGSDFNFKAGEKRRVAFTISNFAGDAKNAMVKVSLVACRGGDDSHAEAQRGRERRECAGCVWSDAKKVKDVRNGEIAAIGEFEVAIPVADKPTKYLLRASFAGGAVKAENEWEVYAFPEVGSRVPRDRMPCRIVSNISRDDLLVAMGRGERVLLLGKGPFKSLRTSFRIGLAGRTSGHYATIIKPGHPALEGLPHEGFCGWQFRRLMQNGAAVQLEAGVPFDPIVEVAASDKYLIRQAMLFEYKVGAGRLLVCSFAFGANDPAAAWLKARLEAYAASDAFNPKQSLTPDQLCAVIDAPLFSAEANKNVALNPDDPASYAKPAAERMDRLKLLIGAYCLQANAKTDAHIKAIHDCGVDFIIGGVPASDRATLDIFAKHGVGAIVNEVVPGWWGGDGKRAGKMRETNPPEKYAAGAAAFKDHPAIWAIDIGDEPSALDFPYYGDVVRQLNKAIPGMPLYLNLYPNYASVAQNNGKQTINQLGTKTYAEHVDVYCREVPLDYISYDFYPYMASSGGTDRFLSKMYDNFIVVSEACRRTKRSFWYVPQVNSRGGLPPTSENRLRFQANAALSFGAEAITWACWCKGWWTNNVIDVTGKQTEQYGKLKRVNAELKQVGLHYMRFRNVATRLVGFAPDSPRRPRLPYSGAPDDPGYVKASNGAPLIVGEMVARDPACGERAYFVTAADDPADAHPAKFDIVFNVKAKRVEAFGGSGAIPVVRRPDGSCAVPLASCQGVLIVVQ